MKKLTILLCAGLLAGLAGCVPYGYYDGYYGRYDNGYGRSNGRYDDRYGYNDGRYSAPQYAPSYGNGYYRNGYYGNGYSGNGYSGNGYYGNGSGSRYQTYRNWQNGY